MKKAEKKEFMKILTFPLFFLFLMWITKIIEFYFDVSFISFGVYPQTLKGLKGILFSPFIHKDITHLFNNSYPILFLGGLLFGVYKNISLKIFIYLFFISGFWLWIIGRPAFHIGASGMIYSLASFLFFSGIVRKNSKLAAVSLITIFLYGSMIWGILPSKDPISWEGHLSGFVAGILLAFYYKDEGPQREKYQWEIDEELESIEIQRRKIEINYTIKKKSN